MKKIDLRIPNHRGYNLDSHALSLTGTDAGVMACTLAPGETSEAHNHFEREAFLFTAGHARVVTPSGEVTVGPGEAVLFDRFESHVVMNQSKAEPVAFHGIYWQDQRAAPGSEARQDAEPLLVFSTPPTPNGDLHCGHLSGPYIAADVLARANRLAGAPAWHVTGRDDHQTYVDKMARQEGRSPAEVADAYSDALRDTWRSYDIGLDGFVSPDRDGPYAAFVRQGLERLIALGLAEVESGPAAFDPDGHYLHEAFISGSCPHCGRPSDGNSCEACGRPNLCTDLGEARAHGSTQPLLMGECRRLVFRLSRLAAQLDDCVKSSEMSARTLAMSLAMLEDGLPDIPITHPTAWGLPVSLPGAESQILYVWFEMAFGYLWGAAHLPCARGEDAWARAASVYDGSIRIAHCYGFDNSWYHTLLFPAVYLALGLAPPRIHIVNELLDLDGEKFSTSRRHLIWGKTLRQTLSSDLARFALLSDRPEGVRSDFTLSGSERQLQAVFGTALPDWFGAFAAQFAAFADRLPEPGAWIGEHQRYHARLEAQAAQLRQAMAPQTGSPRQLARLFAEIAVDGARFQLAQGHLFDGREGGTNFRRTAVALGMVGLRLLATVAQVVTPRLGKELLDWLGIRTWMAGGPKAEFLPSGHAIRPGSRPVLAVCPDRLEDRVPRADGAPRAKQPA